LLQGLHRVPEICAVRPWELVLDGTPAASTRGKRHVGAAVGRSSHAEKLAVSDLLQRRLQHIAFWRGSRVSHAPIVKPRVGLLDAPATGSGQ
jgi:hypothetical protein